MDTPFSTIQLSPSIILPILFRCIILVVILALCLVTWSRHVPVVICTMRLTDIARPRPLDAIWGMLPGNPFNLRAMDLPQADGPARPPPGFLARLQHVQHQAQQHAVQGHQQPGIGLGRAELERQQAEVRLRNAGLEQRRQAAIQAQQLLAARREARREDVQVRERPTAPRAARR
jgi:hypothetical protein